MSTHHSLVLSTASDLGSSEVLGAEEWEREEEEGEGKDETEEEMAKERRRGRGKERGKEREGRGIRESRKREVLSLLLLIPHLLPPPHFSPLPFPVKLAINNLTARSPV